MILANTIFTHKKENHFEHSSLPLGGVLSVIVFIVLIRVALPFFIGYSPNFSIIDATALFCGAVFRKRLVAFGVVFASVWLSDILLSKMLMGHWALFYPGFYWQYASYLLIVCLGTTLKTKLKPMRVFYMGFISAALFFLISNFGSWATGLIYPLTFEGLMTCYIAAIPFYKNTILSDSFFPLLFFGVRQLCQKRAPLWASSALS